MVERHGPQPDQLRRLHRDRGGHRRPAARQRHELGPQGRPPQRGRCRRASKVTCMVLNVDQERKRIALGLKQMSQRPVGERHPRPLQAGRRGRRARSPSSPTSASSSSWSRAWKACCTSPSWPTTRSRAPRTWSRSATRSRSRSCASTRGDRKIGLSRKKAHWTKPDGEEGTEGETADPAAPRAEPASAASKELKGGLGGGGPLFSMGSPAQAESEAETASRRRRHRRRDSGGRRDRRCADERRHSRVTAAPPAPGPPTPRLDRE